MVKRKIRMFLLIIKEIHRRLKASVHVLSTQETLNRIYLENKSISRFGDGEFNLVFGNSLKFQDYNDDICDDLKRVLSDEDQNEACLIGVPFAMYSLNGFTRSSKLFWLKYFAQYGGEIRKYMNPSYGYCDSQISRIFINRSDKTQSKVFFDLWKNIWKDKNVVIFEGELSRFGVGNDLLDSTKSVKRVLCPSENAYRAYEDIFSYALNLISVADLFLFSLGPTATILAYDLSKYGIQCIDTGNMDMEYEWMKKGAVKQVAIKGKYTLEAENGTIVDDYTSDDYYRQIIKIIK